MKNIFRIAIALGVALVIASCEGTGKQKEVEKTADNNTVDHNADHRGDRRQNDTDHGIAEKSAYNFSVILHGIVLHRFGILNSLRMSLINPYCCCLQWL